jgi:hypothetical protein
MPVMKRRSRIVIFRLTDDEYAELKAACLHRGARNVSDFARTALLQTIATEREDVTRKLSEIESGVHRLEKLITEIAKGAT